MRQLGWFFIYGGIALALGAPMAQFDGYGIASWMGVAAVIAGFVVVLYTKKLVLDQGEVAFYVGSAAVGEGGVWKTKDKTQIKLAVTNMGIKLADYMGGRTEQIAIPSQNIISCEKVSRLFVNLNFTGPNAESITMKMQFSLGHTNKFLAALEKAGVKVIDSVGVNSEGLREI
jgi:hypothetical protein